MTDMKITRNMNVKLFQALVGTYFDFKQWKRDTTNGGIREVLVRV